VLMFEILRCEPAWSLAWTRGPDNIAYYTCRHGVDDLGSLHKVYDDEIWPVWFRVGVVPKTGELVHYSTMNIIGFAFLSTLSTTHLLELLIQFAFQTKRKRNVFSSTSVNVSILQF